ncbi:hypothetical protein BH09PAT1_BH09PAT1_0390 [soil metagenome]
MESGTIETSYPLTFREEDTRILGEHLAHRHNVDLIGMKRVGLSSFLRYFLYHKEVKGKFVSKDEKHIFIPVDLNDLVERELYAFWTLTFKRIIDVVDQAEMPADVQQKISALFFSSIQTNDLFLLIDGIRKSLSLLTQQDVIPTLFFLRFDRIKDVVTPEFFDNLQGLQAGTHGKLCYVFTSFRSLRELSPEVFTKTDVSTFYHIMFMRPAATADMQVIADEYMKRYQLDLSSDVEDELFHLVGGNVQYLQLALVILHELKRKEKDSQKFDYILSQDERISLLSEELWESLTHEEKGVLGKLTRNEVVSEEDFKMASYVFESGLVKENEGSYELFNPLFTEYAKRAVENIPQQGEKELVFSKKEHMLFTLLQEHVGEICERDLIIEFVWPEYREFGVSDWSIDRLVARVRSKLKKQSSPFEIRTIRTRGYMLSERS